MELNVLNCKRCGRIFRSENRRLICSVCVKELEEKFDEVKEYIYANSAATIVEVASETNVSVEQIKNWIREERLILTNPAGAGINCMKCGEVISTGKYCNKCKLTMADELKGIYKKKEVTPQIDKSKDEKAKMRFFDRN